MVAAVACPAIAAAPVLAVLKLQGLVQQLWVAIAASVCNGHGRSVVPMPPMRWLEQERARALESLKLSKYTQPNVKPAGDQANNSLTRKLESSSGATEASAGHIASAVLRCATYYFCCRLAVLCCLTKVNL